MFVIIYLCVWIHICVHFLAPVQRLIQRLIQRLSFHSSYCARAKLPIYSACLFANRVARAKPDTARAKANLQRQTIAPLLEML
jgi:hypothetical protein